MKLQEVLDKKDKLQKERTELYNCIKFLTGVKSISSADIEKDKRPSIAYLHKRVKELDEELKLLFNMEVV